MNLQRMKFLTAAGVLGMTVSAQAHPGHGALSEGAAHFISSPYHLAAALVLGGGLWAVGSLLKQRTAKVLARAAGAIVAGGSLLLWSAGI